MLGGPYRPIGDVFARYCHGALVCLSGSVLLVLIIYINLVFARACYSLAKLLKKTYGLKDKELFINTRRMLVDEHDKDEVCAATRYRR